MSKCTASQVSTRCVASRKSHKRLAIFRTVLLRLIALILNFAENMSGVGQVSEREEGLLPEWIALLPILSVCVLFTGLVLCTVLGNLFVIVTIYVDQNLQRAQYSLISWLAVTDLAVGLIVMPIAAIYDVQGKWIMGEFVCNVWISVDVCLCTASILHLLAIALDRYWSVTDMCYMADPFKRQRTIRIMLLLIWVVAGLVSLAPYFGWKDNEFSKRIEAAQCLISQVISYQIFSSMAAFYVPLVFLCILYVRLHGVARARLQAAQRRRAHHQMGKALLQSAMLMPMPNNNHQVNVVPAKDSTGSRNDEQDLEQNGHNSQVNISNNPQKLSTNTNIVPTPTNQSPSPSNFSTKLKNVITRRRRREGTREDARRENKAWRTLAIITGSFVACWLPFFLLAVSRPLLATVDGWRIDDRLTAFTVWLGYVNSTLNPVIYTIFNPDFHSAFKRVIKRLKCK